MFVPLLEAFAEYPSNIAPSKGLKGLSITTRSARCGLHFGAGWLQDLVLSVPVDAGTPGCRGSPSSRCAPGRRSTPSRGTSPYSRGPPGRGGAAFGRLDNLRSPDIGQAPDVVIPDGAKRLGQDRHIEQRVVIDAWRKRGVVGGIRVRERGTDVEVSGADGEDIVGAGVNGTGGRVGGDARQRKGLVGGLHQTRLDGIRTQSRLSLEQESGGARYHRRRHAGTAQMDVSPGWSIDRGRVLRGWDYIPRIQPGERRSGSHQRGHQVPRSHDVRFDRQIDVGGALRAETGERTYLTTSLDIPEFKGCVA